MNRILLASFFSLICTWVAAQSDSTETFQRQLEEARTPTQKVDLLNKLAYEYTQLSLTTADVLANEALEKATKINYRTGMATSLNNLGISYSIRGDYTTGLDYFFKALRIREEQDDLSAVAKTLTNISRVFNYQKDYKRAVEYMDKAVDLYKKANDSVGLARTYISLGDVFLSMDDPAKSLATMEKSREIFARKGLTNLEGYAYVKIAGVLESEKRFREALDACRKAEKLIDRRTDLFTTIELHQTMGSIYAGMGEKNDSYIYLFEAMRMADKGNDSNGRMSTRLQLANMFRKFKDYDSAFRYMDAYTTLNAEVFNIEKSRQMATLEKIYQQEKKDRQLELNNEKLKNQAKVIVIISLLLVFMFILGLVIFRNYKLKARTSIALEKLNREIYEKHEEILAQSEELTQANEEISRINESLEAEVVLRSQKIEQQNKKLIDYAYFNAHNVRGPLARILGLTYLMEREQNPETIKEYGLYIATSAEELDRVIKDINSRLE